MNNDYQGNAIELDTRDLTSNKKLFDMTEQNLTPKEMKLILDASPVGMAVVKNRILGK